METDESASPAVPPGLVAIAGDGSAAKPAPAATADASATAAAAGQEPGQEDEQQQQQRVVTLLPTNNVATMGLSAQQNTALLTQLNGHTFQNGLLSLSFAGMRRDDDGAPLGPEEVASISSYSSVSSPEILSPNPRTPEIPQVEFGDTQCSLVRGAEDLNINTYANGDGPCVVLGKRESSAASDSGDEGVRGAAVANGVFDLSGAISSSQFIFTQFGSGVPGTFTSSSLPSQTSTSNTNSTTKCVPQSVQEVVTATPPAKRLKQPSLNVAHPSKVGPYELKITSQPEEQHRARYLTEGSRGSVKDRGGSSYPTVQLIGYEGPATLQVFVGCDSGKVKPHGFYQACKVYGKSANQFEEREIDGTQVIEIQMDPDMDMKVCIDCVGILKLRNADVEARIGPVRSKKRSNRARLVFRVQVPNGDGGIVTLQTASQPILCTQPVGQPEISRMSLTSAPHNGGVDLYLIGKNFLKGSKVIFRETNANDEALWEKEAQIDPEFFHQMHIICTVPSYDRERLTSPRAVVVVVDSAGRCSEGYHFTYTPGPQQKQTQTAAWRTCRTADVVSVVHCGTAPAGHEATMETEAMPVHQAAVNMETNASLPPSSLFPLIQPPAQPQTITTPPGVQHNTNISSLDGDSPTGSKPTGMLMDSDPMVSSTISNQPFSLVNESSNEMAAWTESTNQTVPKAEIYSDETKVAGEAWQAVEAADNKMEVSHETYKTEEQWHNQQWTANQAAQPQWTGTETGAQQWTPTKTESLPVEIPKPDVWVDDNQTFGAGAEATGFENSWNSVIEVPASTDAQWSTPSAETKPAEHVQFTQAQCAPEMALAPKEFTSGTFKTESQETVLPLPEQQTTLVLRNGQGAHAVLMTAEDVVKDAQTILASGFIGKSTGALTSTAAPATGSVYAVQTTAAASFNTNTDTAAASPFYQNNAGQFGQAQSQQTVPMLITSQTPTPNTYVLLTGDNGQVTGQVIAASQPLEAQPAEPAPTPNQFDQSQSYQPAVQGNPPAPMVLGEAQQSLATGGQRQATGQGEVKDGLSDGTLPTISLEDVCDFLAYELPS